MRLRFERGRQLGDSLVAFIFLVDPGVRSREEIPRNSCLIFSLTDPLRSQLVSYAGPHGVVASPLFNYATTATPLASSRSTYSAWERREQLLILSFSRLASSLQNWQKASTYSLDHKEMTYFCASHTGFRFVKRLLVVNLYVPRPMRTRSFPRTSAALPRYLVWLESTHRQRQPRLVGGPPAFSLSWKRKAQEKHCLVFLVPGSEDQGIK